MLHRALRSCFLLYIAKLNLEVFGGAGAVWGFSEAVGLRTPDTVWFWRPASLIVGGIFFLRWIWQFYNAIQEGRSTADIDDDEIKGDLENIAEAKIVTHDAVDHSLALKLNLNEKDPEASTTNDQYYDKP